MAVSATPAQNHITPHRDQVENAELVTAGRTDGMPFDPLFIAWYAIGEDADKTPHEGAGNEADGKKHHLGDCAQQARHNQSILSALLCTLRTTPYDP
jgi:hypothetical protein